MNDAHRYILYSVAQAIFLIFACLRIIVLRNRGRSTLAQYLTEAFFYTALAGGTGMYIFNVWVVAHTAHITRTYPPAEASARLAEPSYLKGFFFIRITYVITLWSLKSAFLSFYHSLFPRTLLPRAYRAFLLFSCVFVGLTCVVNLGTCVLWCQPIHTNWSLGQNSCSSAFKPTRLRILFATNLVSDVFILTLPFSVLPHLNLQRRECVALGFVFAVGFASVAATGATYWHNNRVITHPGEKSRMAKSLTLLTTAEYATAMVAFCAPALRRWLLGGGGGGGGSDARRGSTRRERKVVMNSFAQRRGRGLGEGRGGAKDIGTNYTGETTVLEREAGDLESGL